MGPNVGRRYMSASNLGDNGQRNGFHQILRTSSPPNSLLFCRGANEERFGLGKMSNLMSLLGRPKVFYTFPLRSGFEKWRGKKIVGKVQNAVTSILEPPWSLWWKSCLCIRLDTAPRTKFLGSRKCTGLGISGFWRSFKLQCCYQISPSDTNGVRCSGLLDSFEDLWSSIWKAKTFNAQHGWNEALLSR